jgi:hypothetical protein
MSAKFVWNDEIRRVATPTSFFEVQVLARNLFDIPNKPLKFTYIDEDGDKITVSSDLELKEALNSIKCPKFDIVIDENPSVQNPEPKSVPQPVVTKPVVTKPVVFPKPQPTLTLRQLCNKVQNLPNDQFAQKLAKQYGFNICRVAWEDTARTKGSCLGENITDMTLNVDNVNMPLIRVPNFADCSWDVPMNKIQCVVGNHSSQQQLRSCSLDKVLKQIWEITDLPFGTNLYCPERDSHVLVQAQACFLPISPGGDAKFNVAVRNYQSSDDNSACLILTVTSKGTSAILTKSGVTKLYFNDHEEKRSFLGQRLKDDRKERGVALEGKMTQQEKQNNVIVVIQIPLKQKIDSLFNPPLSDLYSSDLYSFGDYSFEEKCCVAAPPSVAAPSVTNAFAFGGQTKARKAKCDVENVIVKLAKKEGVFESLSSQKLERDTRFPVRVTLQYYKATSNGTVNEEVLSEISEQIAQAQKNASCWGSLVVENSNRPTESLPQPTPVPSWDVARKMCPNSHTLGLFATPTKNFCCDICGSKFPANNTMFGCRTCNWDVCLSCVYKAKQKVPPSLNQDWTSDFF